MPAHKRGKKRGKKIDSELVRQKLKLVHLETKRNFTEKHGEVQKMLRDRDIELSDLRKHSAKMIGGAALAGALLLGDPTPNRLLAPHSVLEDLRTEREAIPPQSPRVRLITALRQILPEQVRALTREEEKVIERVIDETIGVPVRGTLEGEHLNTNYGRIGAEQHLRRYPGDSLSKHSPSEGEYGDDREEEILEEGIAPGLGAWGYFAPRADKLTEDLEEIERWYAVVQTLYLPDWNSRQPHLKNWYQYRKVLIINTSNGKAVVASIADSGPAAFTGKHFGGSPEVMDYLGGSRYKSGPVLLFFVDDPDNKIPLGPVEYNNVMVGGEARASLGF